ncbi:tail fiber assembly protein [Enterobacter asburiae]|uniref:tail fiber assembly protein n=1 Tax=Enterobacter asburiae TaxID=61645 RepID=UPI0034D27FAD
MNVINSKKVRLLNEATAVIVPLENAVDISIATTHEVESLCEWKIYWVILNRVDPNEPDWPFKPTQ